MDSGSTAGKIAGASWLALTGLIAAVANMTAEAKTANPWLGYTVYGLALVVIVASLLDFHAQTVARKAAREAHSAKGEARKAERARLIALRDSLAPLRAMWDSMESAAGLWPALDDYGEQKDVDKVRKAVLSLAEETSTVLAGSEWSDAVVRASDFFQLASANAKSISMFCRGAAKNYRRVLESIWTLTDAPDGD